MVHDDMAVWTDLLKILVIRSLTPLAQQANQNVNPNHNFNSCPHPNNSYLGQVKHIGHRGTGRDTLVRGGGQPVE